jgi:1-acyl-sn-glycerol-3-phosphate acyltransferase
MARRIAFLVLFPVLTVVISSLCWLTAGFGKNARLAHGLECLWARAALALAGVRVEADLSGLDPGQAYVFMANHQSQFDILVIFWVLRAWNLRFVAKQNLFDIPLFGPAMRRVGHIAIARENSRKAMRAIDEAAAAAERGLSVLIFPEGTRAEDASRLGEFKIGGMIMALKCARPVAPIILTGGAAILPKGRWLPRSGLVTVRAMAPFDPKERFTIKQREAFKTWLHEHMDSRYRELNTCQAA